jgi:hypothetical protein
MTVIPTARAGDVIFIRSDDKQGLGSCLCQILVDPHATFTGRWFTHVAIALDDSVALEASTAPEPDETSWSGIALEEGVRLILLPDLMIPAPDRAVLRHPRGVEVSPAAFDLSSPFMAGLYGSQYSIAALKRSAEQQLGPVLHHLKSESWFDWSSTPADLATKMGLDATFRQKIHQTLPSFTFGFQSRTFFCSELVAVLLTHVGLMHVGPNVSTLTPSGLFAYLQNVGRTPQERWVDVTASDYSDAFIKRWSDVMQSTWEAAYSERLAALRAGQYHHAAGETRVAATAMVEKISTALSEYNEKRKALEALEHSRGTATLGAGDGPS